MSIITMGVYEEKEEEKEEREKEEGGKTWGIERRWTEWNEKEEQEEEQEEGAKKELFDMSFGNEEYSSDHWLFKPFAAKSNVLISH